MDSAGLWWDTVPDCYRHSNESVASINLGYIYIYIVCVCVCVQSLTQSVTHSLTEKSALPESEPSGSFLPFESFCTSSWGH